VVHQSVALQSYMYKRSIDKQQHLINNDCEQYQSISVIFRLVISMAVMLLKLQAQMDFGCKEWTTILARCI